MMNFGILKFLLLLLGGMAVIGSTFRILNEYERAVVFRLGKLLAAKGPGLIVLIPFVDRIRKVDLRLVSIDVPRQDIMTRDNVPATVDAVVYFNIVDPATAIITIQDIYHATFLLAQATLRNVLGQVELDDLLSQQAKINEELQKIISVHTKHWGVNISIVEIKEVTLPEQMKRAMAKQAETERERRARLIDAQAEYQTSQTIAEAGKILSKSPEGMQLRYLQTLRDISTNQGSTILFPFPIDLLSTFVEGIKGASEVKEKIKSGAFGEILSKKEKREERQAKDFSTKEGQGETLMSKIDTTRDKNLRIFSNEEKQAFGPEPSRAISPSEEIMTKYSKELREGRLSPQHVQLVITNRCQSQCSHCETGAGRDVPELTTPEAQRLIEDLADTGCEMISFTGGEPLLRHDLFEIAYYAKNRGIKLGLITNGQAVEENLTPLADIKFDSVVVTLDGYGDTLNKIRNSGDAYERGIKAIEFFHDIGTSRIGVSTILLKENLMEFPRLTEDIFRSGAHVLQIQPQMSENGLPFRNPPEVVKNAFRFILEARTRGFPVEAGEQFGYIGPLEQLIKSTPFFCGCGWNTFCITPDGKAQGCPVLTKPEVNEGDWRKDSLKNIWEKEFKQFRGEIPDGLPEGCQRCPHLSLCRGGCWLFRIMGMNPCFLQEAEEVYREITNAALYTQTP